MRPRLGFLGLGWIGRHRLRALADSGLVEIAALADAAPEAVDAAAAIAPGAARAESLDALLERDLDGVVIATPSARHAADALRALGAGAAVFCQKPLARTEGEAADVVRAARGANRLLSVDLCYRHTAAAAAMRELVAGGSLGEVYAFDLVFHNAYGPDRPWYYDRRLSGGGCVVDLGIHLVDLVAWLQPDAAIEVTASQLFRQGAPWSAAGAEVEDFAVAQLRLSTGAAARLACSWKAPAGRDAVIVAECTGTRGAARFSNAGGSFYDFTLERLTGTTSATLVRPPDEWGGRAAIAWARRLAESAAFDPSCAGQVALAAVLDRIYAVADQHSSASRRLCSSASASR